MSHESSRGSRRGAPGQGGRNFGGRDGGKGGQFGNAGRGSGGSSGGGWQRRDRPGQGPQDRRGPARSGAGRDQRSEGLRVDPVRRVVFDVLVAVTSRDAYANLLLPKFLRDRRISGRDAAFATEITYGTLRQQGFLDAVLAAASSRPLKEVEPRVLAMLRMGAYQLLFTRVPPHAAVSATVGVAKVALTDGPARFVNAALRRVAEHDEAAWFEAVAPDRSVDPVAFLAVKYSHPEWIVRAISETLGERTGELPETEEAVRANNERPRVVLATRPGRIGRAELAEQVHGEPGKLSPYAVELREGGDPGNLRAVKAGEAGVQDEGSQLVALAMTEAPLEGADKNWLDLCAGPGGKAALLAGVAAERGASLTAVEVAEHRAELVKQALAGTDVTVVTADGRSVGENPALPEGAFDRVLVDAPCTGLGSLRRRPESRWRRQPSDIGDLAKLQRELLTAAVRATRSGGIIAYTTCSPHIAETKVTVADVARKEKLEQIDTPAVLRRIVGETSGDAAAEKLDVGAGSTAQLWPHRHGTDAMFVALLRKP